MHTVAACHQALVYAPGAFGVACDAAQADLITPIASKKLQRPSRSIPVTSVRSVRAPQGAVELAADHAGFVVDEAGRAETVAAPPPLS